MASLSRAEILGKVYKMVPPMLEKFHKGEHETSSKKICIVANETNVSLQVSSDESQSLAAAKTIPEHPTSPPWLPQS
jgi:hypothetical protein